MENQTNTNTTQMNGAERRKQYIEWADAILLLQAKEELGLTLADIARHIGYSPNGTLSNWISDGKMPKRAALLVQAMIDDHRVKNAERKQRITAALEKGRAVLAEKRKAAAAQAPAPAPVAAPKATAGDAFWVLKRIEGDRVTLSRTFESVGTMQIEGREYLLVPKA